MTSGLKEIMMGKIDDLVVTSIDNALENSTCGSCGKDLDFNLDTTSEDPCWNVLCCGFNYKIVVSSVEVYRVREDDDRR